MFGSSLADVFSVPAYECRVLGREQKPEFAVTRLRSGPREMEKAPQYSADNAGGTQRLPRTIGMPAALMHILMGKALSPREAERKGLVHETVSGKAVDRAMEIARRLSSHTPESVGYIKRLVRNAIETPLAQGLALERNLFLKLCISEAGLARMRSYDEKKITSPSRSFEI